MFVAWNMGEWREFVRAQQFSLNYRTILFGTFALTVIFDLTVAVEVGLVLACLFFIWRMGSLFEIRDLEASEHACEHQPLPAGVQAFELYGSLFFGAVGQVEDLPTRLRPDVRAVVLDMHRLVSMDTSGLEALQQLHRALQRRQVALVLADVNPQPLSLIRRSGFELTLGPDHIVPQVGGLRMPADASP
jgi:SulP family sulfate permease